LQAACRRNVYAEINDCLLIEEGTQSLMAFIYYGCVRVTLIMSKSMNSWLACIYHKPSLKNAWGLGTIQRMQSQATFHQVK
jgi:hypothetical protein